jgi:hypothetical protein
MGISASHLREYVITPVLNYLNLKEDREVAINLLLGTAAQETHMGLYLHQLKGPALGLYQIEPATYQDLFNNVFPKYALSLSKIEKLRGEFKDYGPFDMHPLIGNLYYQTAIARFIYYRWPTPLPPNSKPLNLAHYYKQWWNSGEGKATPLQFIENYRKYVGNTK